VITRRPSRPDRCFLDPTASYEYHDVSYPNLFLRGVGLDTSSWIRVRVRVSVRVRHAIGYDTHWYEKVRVRIVRKPVVCIVPQLSVGKKFLVYTKEMTFARISVIGTRLTSCVSSAYRWL